MVSGVRPSRSASGQKSAALRISRAIDVVAESPKGLTAAEAAPGIGLTRTAALRMLDSMVESGILVKDEDSKRYTLSLKVFEWGGRAAARFLPIASVRHEMARLADDGGYQIIYSVLDGDYVVIVEATEVTAGAVTTRPAGTRIHWITSTTGTLLVACCEPRLQRRLLDNLETADVESVWPETDLEYLLEGFRNARFVERRLQEGTYTLAAPILDYSGYAIAALGLFVTGEDAHEREKAADALKATASLCSSFLGYSSFAPH
jgi:DNA-binding IclR family transcriptional regulator